MPIRQRILLIETSGRGGFTALAEDESIVAVAPLTADRQHGRDLAPSVAGLLRDAGWSPRQVAAVVVSRGPGSFTSLRVGIASAKAFAYAVGCALLGVDTFACYAQQCPFEWSAVEVIGDAQRRRLQVQRYDLTEPATFTASEPIRLVPIETWLGQRWPSLAVTGPALALVRDRLPSDTPTTTPHQCIITPQTLLRLGLARLQRGQRDSIWTFEPLYAQLSTAEEKQQANTTPDNATTPTNANTPSDTTTPGIG